MAGWLMCSTSKQYQQSGYTSTPYSRCLQRGEGGEGGEGGERSKGIVWCSAAMWGHTFCGDSCLMTAATSADSWAKQQDGLPT